jgi:hypothetical protein
MSIVVSCRECEASYTLPNRYAGKRCKCKECKAKIRVPADAAAEAPKKRKRKPEKVVAGAVEAKPERPKKKRRKKKREEAVETVTEAKPKRRKKKSKSKAEKVEDKKTKTFDEPKTRAKKRVKDSAKKAKELLKKAKRSATRRLGSQEGSQIREEGRALRGKLGGGRRKLRGSTSPVSESIHQLAPLNSGDRLDPIGIKPRALVKGKGRAAKGKTTAKLSKGRKTAKRGTAKLRKKGAARIQTRPGKRGARRATRSYGRRRDTDEELDEDEALAPNRNSARYALFAALGLVGLLCMGVGLAVGGAFGGGGEETAAVSGTTKKLDFIEAVAWKGNWEAAKKEADELAASLKAGGDTEGLAKLKGLRLGIDNMVTIRSIEDDEDKLNQLLRFVHDKLGPVRLGVAIELRPLAFQEEAQGALVQLTKDSDKRVVSAAKQGLVHAGGPKSIPFLLETIVDTAQTGGKLGDIAIERALEIHEPEVVPVLVKILEVRSKANASVLRRALNNLADLAEGDEASKAAEAYLEHEDESVKKAAKACSR